MLDRIHQSKIIELMERRENGRPVEFSLQYCKKTTGELCNYERCVLTSVHSAGATVNVLVDGESQPKKLRRCLITRINGMKVYF